MGKVRPIEIVFPLMLLVVLMAIHYAIGMSGALMKPDGTAGRTVLYNH